MGIPSYFKHILDRYPRLLTENITPADILLVDFNCLIYGCIHSKSLPAYSHEIREQWEAALLKEICAYVVHLWKTAGKPGVVLLAVDGVVPMAKIRQQRLRRFKSVWLTEQERIVGVRRAGEEVWDTNSITPGTEFMEKLNSSLEALCASHNERGGSWTVSGADQPGEGEQKLMQWVRSQKPEGKHVMVYGLDADLIILCILHRGTVASNSTWSILREKQEFLKKAVPNDGAKYPPCLLLSVSGFEEVLFPDESKRSRDMYDYIAGMSLLGNDFIPHSLGIHLRDGGHDRLISVLSILHSENTDLILRDATGIYRWNPVALSRIFREWGGVQEEDLEHAFRKKYTMRSHPPKIEAERRMLSVQNLPLELAAENKLWDKLTGKLHTHWKDTYYMETRDDRALTTTEIRERCCEYLRGLQWALDYYLGQREVSREWVYSWTYPPMWSDLAEFLQTSPLPEPPVSKRTGIQPQEQLTLVLPLESWNLIRNPVLKSVPSRAPHFWPKNFTFSTLGKRWMWECHPNIPIPTIRRLLALTQN